MPHARAALLEGGIIWQLAKEVLGDSLDEEVLYGPSLYVAQFGKLVLLGSQEFWDDTLSNQECDFIIGMNRTYTGKQISLLLSPLLID
jgi:hypothetical protein